MNIDAINRIAGIIRQHRNGTDPAVLAADIAGQLGDAGRAGPIANVMRRVNPNHTMGAGNLAEHIYTDVYDFDPSDNDDGHDEQARILDAAHNR